MTEILFKSNQFETLHRCYKHIEDVHATFNRQENCQNYAILDLDNYISRPSLKLPSHRSSSFGCGVSYLISLDDIAISWSQYNKTIWKRSNQILCIVNNYIYMHFVSMTAKD